MVSFLSLQWRKVCNWALRRKVIDGVVREKPVFFLRSILPRFLSRGLCASPWVGVSWFSIPLSSLFVVCGLCSVAMKDNPSSLTWHYLIVHKDFMERDI